MTKLNLSLIAIVVMLQLPQNLFALWSYDLGGTSGTTNQTSYSELNLGLNWQFTDNFIWRNAFFHRSVVGESSVSGVDSSLRYTLGWSTDSNNLGLRIYAGPGYRFASENNAALLTEAGVGIKLFGLGLGFGVKSLFYQNPGTTSTGVKRASNDVAYFVTISGSGSL